jgi:cysteine-rich repeat protein
VCGNHVVEPGETCDDGNTVDGDACPSTCRIEACAAVPGTARAFTVDFARPAGSDVAGITVLLDYPEGKVSIPGSGGAATVKSSIANLPAGALGTPNDLDYAVREVVASFSPIPPGRLFTVTFQDCQGAVVPTADEFVCKVEDVSDPLGLPVDGVTCTVQPG